MRVFFPKSQVRICHRVRAILFPLLLAICCLTKAQTGDSLKIPSGTILYDLKMGDSVTYYQCHVEEAIQQMTTQSGQTVTGTSQKYTVTEKYVLHRITGGFEATYFTASLNVFPNRKFSGLKIREKSYWGFNYVSTFKLSEQDLKVLLALEKKGREALEFDYAITKYTTNQIIIKRKKNFKELVIDGNYVISKLIKT